jgi:trehalose 6-phosphate synthase/phosphatase
MSKIILVSNRLSVTVEKNDEKIIYTQSSGGLATGMKSLIDKNECVWIGYPGITEEEMIKSEKNEITNKLNEKYNSVPVYLSQNDVEMFYEGFSNKTIWPLFHYFQGTAVYDSLMWDSYKKVNKMFLDEIIKVVKEDDIIWVHDYHLMLLPQLIREKIPEARIGFFLHIPFPSSEIYRQLPWREEVLEGMLGAGLIGFHTISYVRHFLSSVRYILGYESIFGNVNLDGRNLKVDTFPMGIDFNLFSESVKDEDVKKEIEDIKLNLDGRKIILSIDRLDYTKGLIQRLESYDYFLDKYPQYLRKVVLIMVAIPSRTQVEEYENLTNKLEMVVSRINGKYSTIDWSPIRYLYRSIPFNTLIALYERAEVALVTPLRDGMNLVAKEYVAVKTQSKDGILIISEMAGVAEELGETIKINPNNKMEIAETIDLALNMPLDRKKRMMEVMQKRLKRNDVFKWSNDFIEKLKNLSFYNYKHHVDILRSKDKHSLIDNFKKAEKRLLLLDYDGTLVGFHKKPEQAVPDEELLTILTDLVKNSRNRVVIISGRDKEFINHWFGHFNCTLVAEHGVWMREIGSDWRVLVPGDDVEWKSEIRTIFESMVDKAPNTSIEEKSHAMVWHYRNADRELISMRILEMKATLSDIISNLNLTMSEGNKILEVRRSDIDKGKIVHLLTEREKPEFIFAVGDDTTDEDMFRVLVENEEAETIKVGVEDTYAKHYVNGWRDIRKLLIELAKND